MATSVVLERTTISGKYIIFNASSICSITAVLRGQIWFVCVVVLVFLFFFIFVSAQAASFFFCFFVIILLKRINTK